MRKQSVSGPAAVLVILIACIVFFALFSRPQPETPQLAKPVPFEPEINADQQTNARKGTLPLGLNVLFPPLPEDRMKVARVALVHPDGPAARAGIKVGDAITAFNGTEVTTGDALSYLLTQVKPDQTYSIQVTRAEASPSGQAVEKKLKLSVTGITPLPPEERVR